MFGKGDQVWERDDMIFEDNASFDICLLYKLRREPLDCRTTFLDRCIQLLLVSSKQISPSAKSSSLSCSNHHQAALQKLTHHKSQAESRWLYLPCGEHSRFSKHPGRTDHEATIGLCGRSDKLRGGMCLRSSQSWNPLTGDHDLSCYLARMPLEFVARMPFEFMARMPLHRGNFAVLLEAVSLLNRRCSLFES